MCGFAGFVDFGGRGDLALLRSMTDTLVHRGPDDSGYELVQLGEVRIGLGFRRLSIIDLSPAGHQPMTDPGTGNWILLNGEVYNYAEIRKELLGLGHNFKSASDTEVVLHAYAEWGIRAVDRFIGMFAVVLFDKSNSRITLLRDRAGVKPLFYYEYAGGFLFASELKAFHPHPEFRKEIDPASLKTFFFNGNIPAPATIFRQAFKVEPGHYIEFDLKNNQKKSCKYWDAFDYFNATSRGIAYDDALSETERLMRSAFSYRMVSDVPVGVFLSGGYDSTAVAALLADSNSGLNTYTIGFEDSRYDESNYAEQVAKHLGTRHSVYHCTMKEALDIIPELPTIYDEPFADSSAIPTTLVSRVARRHVTVALSADAGDELFAGYPRHRKASGIISRLNGFSGFLKGAGSAGLGVSGLLHPALSKPDRLEKLRLLLKSKDVIRSFHIINQTFTEKEINHFVKSAIQFPELVFDHGDQLRTEPDILNKILAVEYKSYLVDDILQKVDRATMSASLEGREPLLDHRLLEFVAGLPAEYKLLGGVSKRLLKDIVHRYVPIELMDRPKMGFGIPVSSWMKSELRELFEDVLGDEKIRQQEWFDAALLLELKKDYLNGKLHDFERIWFVFIFLQWYKKWMS